MINAMTIAGNGVVNVKLTCRGSLEDEVDKTHDQ